MNNEIRNVHEKYRLFGYEYGYGYGYIGLMVMCGWMDGWMALIYQVIYIYAPGF